MTKELVIAAPEELLPDNIMAEIDGYSEMGYSDKAEDKMIPIIAVLQDNSGEVKKKGSKYIEGAEPGDIIIRSLGRVISMAENAAPIQFQPCGFDHVWVEWSGEPGDGAVVGQFPFDDMPQDATERVDPENPDRKIWVRENGNRLQDTRYHYGHIIEDDGSLLACVLPMGGSNHSVSRSWTAVMDQFKLPSGKRAKSFMRSYAVRSQFQERGSQAWYKYKIDDLGWIGDKNTLMQGFALFKSILSHMVVAEATEAPSEATTDDDIPV